MTVPFEMVGVFGSTTGGGSPLAVVHDADDLSTPEMGWIAARLRADETVFVLRPEAPGATHRVRVFTPHAESPFGGHSAVGTAVSLVRSGRVPPGEVVQQCGPTLLRLHADAERATITATGPLPVQPLDAGPALESVGLGAGALAGDPALAGFGPLFHLVPVHPAALAAARPDYDTMARHDLPDIVLFTWDERQRAATARVFAPGYAIPADPACGSVGLAMALWRGGDADFVVHQGAELGRASRLDCTIRDGRTATVAGAAPRELLGELGHARVRRTSSAA